VAYNSPGFGETKLNRPENANTIQNIVFCKIEKIDSRFWKWG